MNFVWFLIGFVVCVGLLFLAFALFTVGYGYGKKVGATEATGNNSKPAKHGDSLGNMVDFGAYMNETKEDK